MIDDDDDDESADNNNDDKFHQATEGLDNDVMKRKLSNINHREDVQRSRDCKLIDKLFTDAC